MHLFLKRNKSGQDEMLGKLWLDKKHYLSKMIPFCYTLEDEKREIKVAGETAIPSGFYKIKLRPLGESRMDESYTRRYEFYEGQLWLQNVENFTYVYIHTGNNDDHTEGCILVGNTQYKDAIGGSRAAYRRLYPVIAQALKEGETVYITIEDADE